MEIFFILLVVLVTTRIFGEVFHRLKQPALLEELVAGLVVGAAVTFLSNRYSNIPDFTNDRVFVSLTELGMFFLMLYGGIEMRISELIKYSGKSFYIAAGGFALPLAGGYALAWFFLPHSEMYFIQCLIVGIALAITAVPVSIRLLMDLGKLNTPMGQTIVTAAVFDDVFSIVLVAILTWLIKSEGAIGGASLLKMGGATLLFFAIVFVVGRLLVPRIARFVRNWKTVEFEFSSLVVGGLALAILADLLGLHFILGAFAAGLLFEKKTAGREVFQKVKKRVSAVTLGFLAPVFFASIGMRLDLSALFQAPLFLTILVLLAFLTKLIGAGLPAYYFGFSKREAVAVGVGMSARGAVELVIADIALKAGVFSHPHPPPPIVTSLFSAIVIVAVVTTMVAPLALKLAIGDTKKPASE